MSKQGPCLHCGIKGTPLWSNGPQEKPVLCNACGSRYRQKGNLDDYIPNHTKSRFPQLINPQQTNPNCSYKTRSRNASKNNIDQTSSNVVATSSSSSTTTTNKSTSDHPSRGIDTNSWKSSIPSRKRSSLVEEGTELSLEKFHKQLLDLWEIQKAEIESSKVKEVLVYNQNSMTPSNEIGLGCVALDPDLKEKSDHHH